MLITCVKSNETTNTVEDLKFTGILQTDLNCYIAPPGFLVPKCVVVLLNVKKGKQSHIINSSKKTITSLAYSWDGKYIVTGECGHQPSVRIWDAQERTQISEFPGHKYGIICVAFSPNSKYVVSIGSQHDMIVNVWDWKNNIKVASNKVSSKVKAISFSSSGDFFVTVGNRHVKFWYLEYSRSSKHKLEAVPLMGRSAILGEQRNNYFCCVSCGRGKMSESTFAITKSGLLCEFNSRRLLDKWVELRTTSANCMSVSDSYIFVGCADGVVRCFSQLNLHFLTTLPKTHHLGVDVSKGLSISHMGAHPANSKYPDTVALTYDEINKKVTCIYNDHSIYTWEVKDLKKIGKGSSYLYHSACIWGIEMYPQVGEDCKFVLPPGSFVTCSSDDTVRIWNLDSHMVSDTAYKRNYYSNELLKILYMDDDLAYLCDSGYNSTGSNDKTDTTYDGKNGVRCVRIDADEAHDSEVLCLEYSHPSTAEKAFDILDLEYSKPERVFKDQIKQIQDLPSCDICRHDKAVSFVLAIKSVAAALSGAGLANDIDSELRIDAVKSKLSVGVQIRWIRENKKYNNSCNAKHMKTNEKHVNEEVSTETGHSAATSSNLSRALKVIQCDQGLSLVGGDRILKKSHKFLASASRDRLIHVFDVNQDYAFQQTLDDHSSSITAVRFVQAQNDLMMLSCSADKSIIFRTAQFNPQLKFTRHQYYGGKTTLYDMDVDVSQKHILTACQDRNIRVFNVSTGKQSKNFKGTYGEEGTLIKVVLDNSGMYLATSSTDKNLSIHDYYSGECVAATSGHSELVTGLKFTNDCKHLISVSGDGCIFVWKLPSQFTHTMRTRLAQLEKHSMARAKQEIKEIRRQTVTIGKSMLELSDDSMDKINFQTATPEFLNPNSNDIGDDLNIPGYRFSVGQLPAWAKKKINEDHNPSSFSEPKSVNPVQPKGRWAHRVDSFSDKFIGKSSVINESVELREKSASKPSDIRRETMILSKNHENMEFSPCGNSIKAIRSELNLRDIDSDKVTKSRGSIFSSSHYNSMATLDLSPERHRNITESSSGTSISKLEDFDNVLDNEQHDGDIDSDDSETDTTEPETAEIIYYPPHSQNDNDSTFRVQATSEKDTQESKFRNQNVFDRSSDAPPSSTPEVEDGSEDEDVGTTIESNRNIMTMLNMSTENLDRIDKRETYMKNNYENLESSEFQDNSKDSINSSDSSSYFENNSDTYFNPRHSISAKFLSKSLDTAATTCNTYGGNLSMNKLKEEHKFQLQRVSHNDTKFFNVLAALPSETVARIPASVLERQNYIKLQEEVVALFERSKPELFDQLISTTVLTGRPSLFLEDVRAVAAKVVRLNTVNAGKITVHGEASVHVIIPAMRHKFSFRFVIADMVTLVCLSRYLLTCIDRATRWTEAVPLADITAKSVALGFLNTWISRFGVPLIVHTDRGRQFESELFNQLSHIVGFHRLRTSAYHPQANGLIERFHRTFKTAIMARKQDWLLALPIVLLGIHSIPNNSTFAPFTAVRGGMIMMPRPFLHPVTSVDNDFVEKLVNVMSQLDVEQLSHSSHHNTAQTFLPPELMTCDAVWVRIDRAISKQKQELSRALNDSKKKLENLGYGSKSVIDLSIAPKKDTLSSSSVVNESPGTENFQNSFDPEINQRFLALQNEFYANFPLPESMHDSSSSSSSPTNNSTSISEASDNTNKANSEENEESSKSFKLQNNLKKSASSSQITNYTVQKTNSSPNLNSLKSPVTSKYVTGKNYLMQTNSTLAKKVNVHSILPSKSYGMPRGSMRRACSLTDLSASHTSNAARKRLLPSTPHAKNRFSASSTNVKTRPNDLPISQEKSRNNLYMSSTLGRPKRHSASSSTYSNQMNDTKNSSVNPVSRSISMGSLIDVEESQSIKNSRIHRVPSVQSINKINSSKRQDSDSKKLSDRLQSSLSKSSSNSNLNSKKYPDRRKSTNSTFELRKAVFETPSAEQSATFSQRGRGNNRSQSNGYSDRARANSVNRLSKSDSKSSIASNTSRSNLSSRSSSERDLSKIARDVTERLNPSATVTFAKTKHETYTKKNSTLMTTRKSVTSSVTVSAGQHNDKKDLEKSPQELPVKDKGYTGYRAITQDVNTAPLSRVLCDSLAEDLRQITSEAMVLFERVTLDKDLPQPDKSELMNILAQGVWQAQQNLRPAVPPLPIYSSISSDKSSQVMSPSHLNFGSKGTMTSASPLDLAQQNFYSSKKTTGSDVETMDLLQQYSDMLLNVIQQRIVPGQQQRN
ncbi:Mitogen-activated protein kinase-binding protein 1 [Nymphon striatum]|nr:Mitogen-activated protein kinase-binding protein 1 [Nymphon striatum]